MSGPLNQFSVYRLRRDTRETRTRRHQSYAYLKQYGLPVRSDFYDQLYLSEFDQEQTEMELRRQLEKDLPADASGDTLAVGGVLAITREGFTEAFYVDKQSLVPLKGFFHVASSSGLLTMDTKDYQIEGRAGNWFAAEETWIDGRHFLLMQSQKHGTNAAYAVLDSRGNLAAEDTYKGFTPETIRQIREYIKRQEEARLMVIGGRGFLPVEAVGKLPEVSGSIKRVPLYRKNLRVTRKYCIFWPEERKGCYIEEFAEKLRKRLS